MNAKKPPQYRRRIPRDIRDIGARQRTLHDVFIRSLEVTLTMDAERHMILATAFAHVFEVPLPKFEFALRRHKRGETLRQAAAALAKKVSSVKPRSRVES